MKKTIYVIAVIFLLAFTSKNFDNKASAIVNQYEGIYIYTDSKPSQEYEYLGTVKPLDRALLVLGVSDSQYTSIRDKLIKSAKKKYPNSDGLILSLTSSSIDKADVIKLK